VNLDTLNKRQTVPSKRRGSRVPRSATTGPKPRLSVDPIKQLALRVLHLDAQNRDLKELLKSVKVERDGTGELLDSMPVGIVQLSDAGIIRSANSAFWDLIGRRDCQLVGNAISSLVHKEDLLTIIEHLRRCRLIRRPAFVEVRLRLSSREVVPVQMISARTGERGSTLLQTVVISTAERNAARAQLEQSQRRYQAMLEAVEGIVWEADGVTLDIAFVSRYADKLLGYPSDRWLKAGFWENHIHVDDRDRVMAKVSRALTERKNFSADYRVTTANRTILWIHDQVTVRVHEGKPRLLGIAVNITEQKTVELQLKESHTLLETRVSERTAELQNSISELEAFSYSLSHDLRAPLRAIRGYSEILQSRMSDKLGPAESELLNRIQNSARRMDALIQDVLRYSRVVRGPVEFKPLNIEKIISGVIQDYPNLQPPQAEIVLEKPFHNIFGHEAFLTQCVSNLLCNAVKFTNPGTKPRIAIDTAPYGNEVEISFKDNGFGIPHTDQNRIFGIFNRLHHSNEIEGTGIGLAIVKKAAERMGGRVGVESEPGKGSRFWLRLPAAK